MKFIGLSGLCLAFSLSGIYVSLIKKRRIGLLFEIAEFFGELSDSVMLRRGDILCCIKLMSSRDGFPCSDFANEISVKCTPGCNMKDVWVDCIKGSPYLKGLSADASERLCGFSDNFGKLPPDVFCEKCRIYSEAFRKIATGENEKWEKNRTLIMSSGVLCAAAVFFILL